VGRGRPWGRIRRNGVEKKSYTKKLIKKDFGKKETRVIR